MKKTVTSFLLFIAYIITPAFSVKAQEASFQDWAVFCEQGFCKASTKDQRDLAGNLVLTRLSEKQALWTLSLELPKNAQRLEPKNLRVAGHRPADIKRKRDFTFSPNHKSIYFTNSGTIQLVFRRSINGRRLFIDFRNSENHIKRASFSLNGLSAALLYIDEKQGRIASRREIGLFVEKKQNTRITAEELAFQQHQKTLTPETCDLNPEEIYATGLSVEKLNDKNHLVIIPCYLAAYNSGARLFLVDEEAQKATLLLWANYSDLTGWSGTDILSNAHFDNQTKEITMVHKGRGLGDCGISGRWKWQSGFFTMQEFRAKENCDGEPKEWPIVFQPQN